MRGVGGQHLGGLLPYRRSAWDGLNDAALPGQTDRATVAAMQRQRGKPDWRTVVSVRIPDRSGFKHRDELHAAASVVCQHPPPRLPVVMMIGGEFGNPTDWLQAGDAQRTIVDFAAGHGGNAPVLVFPDSSGTFSNDTECVNGVRGNAADHLTKDVVPYIISNFGVSRDPANWGIVGWSAGGTCALTLSVMHPELFRAFVDIDGQLGPTAGTKQQTIDRLFGGDADAWAAFDPRTVIAKHGVYSGLSGWFAVSVDTPTVYRAPTDAGSLPADDADPNPRTMLPSPIVCANRPAATASSARWCPTLVSTTSHPRRRRSPRRCPGWPESSEHPGSRRSQCRRPSAPVM